jgi:hypothetical protein
MLRSAGKILMLVENYFPQDTRVAKEATLLTDAGYQVSVVALRRKGQARHDTLNRVEVYRLPTLELFKKTPFVDVNRMNLLLVKLKSFLGYVVEYCYFTTACPLLARISL